MSVTFKWCKDKTRLSTCDRQVFCFDSYGNKWWYLNGKRYSESDYWKELNK